MSINRFLLAIAAFAICCAPTRAARDVPEQTASLRVMTYNVNYGLAGDEATLNAIRAVDVDVVFLQETTPAWEATLREELSEEYPHMAFHECCGAGGLGVMSKREFVDLGILDPPEGGWFPAWHVLLETPLGKIQALNVHLRPPRSDGGSVVSGYFSTRSIRQRQIATYWQEVAADYPTIVAGDFNENEKGRAVSFLRARGLESALPEFDRSAETWRWKTSVGTVSSTLDHVVYDERFEPVNAEVVPAGRSDHLPVVVTFVEK